MLPTYLNNENKMEIVIEKQTPSRHTHRNVLTVIKRYPNLTVLHDILCMYYK